MGKGVRFLNRDLGPIRSEVKGEVDVNLRLEAKAEVESSVRESRAPKKPFLPGWSKMLRCKAPPSTGSG